MKHAWAAFVALTLASCKPAVSVGPPDLGTRKHAPLTQAESPTTDGAIAAGNLSAQVQGLTKVVESNPRPSPLQLASLSGALLAEGQFFGKLADYDRAAELADRAVKTGGVLPQSWLARAAVESTFHRFADARADLDQAEKLVGRRAQIDAARVSIALATGEEEQAFAASKKEASARPDITSMGLYAAALGDRGEVAEAERLFTEAQYHNGDVSPFPVAWLYLQYGLLEQKLGRLATARELFEAAHERLPVYAPATSHLAALLALTGEKEKAIQLLRGLIESSDDPEYWGQLAELLAETGATAEADKLRALAQKRYDELVKKHPEAFADHAARFWMGPGGDANKALALAQRNLAARQTRDAYQLVIEAATAARSTQLACQAARTAVRLPYASPTLHLAAARAFDACGDKAGAAEELKAAAR